MNEAEKLVNKFNNIPAEEPDEWEKEAIAEFKEAKSKCEETEYLSLEDVKARAERANGRISLRVPRQLHADLIDAAEDSGVSLNQYISYILASRLR